MIKCYPFQRTTTYINVQHHRIHIHIEKSNVTVFLSACMCESPKLISLLMKKDSQHKKKNTSSFFYLLCRSRKRKR